MYFQCPGWYIVGTLSMSLQCICSVPAQYTTPCPQWMEYTGAVGVGLLEMVDGLANKTDVQVSGLDLTVTDLETRVQEVETRQTNLGGM